MRGYAILTLSNKEGAMDGGSRSRVTFGQRARHGVEFGSGPCG